MKVFYNIDIQMKQSYEITDDLVSTASKFFGFMKMDIDERETYHLGVTFLSEKSPRTMRDDVKALLRTFLEIFYIDVIYRFDYEMTPDRFVIWWDGKTQEYTGHVTFTEDK